MAFSITSTVQRVALNGYSGMQRQELLSGETEHWVTDRPMGHKEAQFSFTQAISALSTEAATCDDSSLAHGGPSPASAQSSRAVSKAAHPVSSQQALTLD